MFRSKREDEPPRKDLHDKCEYSTNWHQWNLIYDRRIGDLSSPWDCWICVAQSDAKRSHEFVINGIDEILMSVLDDMVNSWRGQWKILAVKDCLGGRYT